MQACLCSGGKTIYPTFYIWKCCYLMFRSPWVQILSKNTTMFVWVTLAITLIAYGVSSLLWFGISRIILASHVLQSRKRISKGEGDGHSEQPNVNKQLWCVFLVIRFNTLYELHQQFVHLVSGFQWFLEVFGFRETWKPETWKPWKNP